MIDFFPNRAVAISIFGFSVYWYGLLYLLGFVNAIFMLPRLERYRSISFSREQWAELLSFAVIGVIVGGRLGYVLLYEPSYFFMHPLSVFSIRDGGMAFHGGMMGVIAAVLYFVRKYRVSLLSLTDVVVVPVAIGLALGRLGNFLNQELYGTVTTVSWGMHFDGVEGLRHPLQLYGIVKNLLIASLCFLALRRRHREAGSASAVFLLAYGTLRFLLEFVREQNQSVFTLSSLVLTRGQLYCIPMILAGAVLVFLLRGQSAKASARA